MYTHLDTDRNPLRGLRILFALVSLAMAAYQILHANAKGCATEGG